MGFSIREIESECKFSSALTVDALSQVIPPTAITQVIAQEGVGEVRKRGLTAALTVWLVIALHRYPTVAISGVLRKLARGLRFLWPNPTIRLPGDRAIAARRAVQAGLSADGPPPTPGAFLFGLRLMALAGTSEDVPDPPANAAALGRHTRARGARAFPQRQGVELVETGTPAVVDAGCWPGHTSERVGGFRLLRSVQRGMRLRWDRGFHDFAMVVATRRRGAHVLRRRPAHGKPLPLRTLADGSVLAYLLPGEERRRRRGERILVRVITDILTDPMVPGQGEEHRVIPTGLKPRIAPAHAVACAYHERWEIEIVIEEIDTQQRLVGRTLRSLTPVGVLQERDGGLLAHYAVRWLLQQAALQAAIDPDRLSFVHAWEIVRDAVPEFQRVVPAQPDALYARLLDDIAAKRLPERRTRTNPRVVKRKMSHFKLKRPTQSPPGTPLGSFRDAVVVQPPPVLELPCPTLGLGGAASVKLHQCASCRI